MLFRKAQAETLLLRDTVSKFSLEDLSWDSKEKSRII